EKLGTVADKVERVAKLAEWLVSLEGNGFYQSSPGDTLHGEVSEAARLCKADLVTEMVGEFPDLQGLMGGYYAEKQGKSAAIANAIRDHYKPVGQGDDVPTDPVTVAVSLADKLDTLVGFFFEDEKPTGSKDPFALRRASIGVIRTILENNIRLNLSEVLETAVFPIAIRLIVDPNFELAKAYETVANWRNDRFIPDRLISDLLTAKVKSSNIKIEERKAKSNTSNNELLNFFADRLKVQQREAGVRHDLIGAVFALGGEDDLVRLLARVKALQAFVETGDGENLLAGYKRASNILKKEGGNKDRHPELVSGSKEDSAKTDEILKQVQNDGYDKEPAEKALIDALDAAQPQVTAAIEAEKFEEAMTSLAALRAPIDKFFEDVTVNDDDSVKREARLALLNRFRDAVHQVADFSKIEG
ncbi:MAG: glycine--tRNA ligase subunit beta, partial [Parasphingorhabdus sp.]